MHPAPTLTANGWSSDGLDVVASTNASGPEIADNGDVVYHPADAVGQVLGTAEAGRLFLHLEMAVIGTLAAWVVFEIIHGAGVPRFHALACSSFFAANTNSGAADIHREEFDGTRLARPRENEVGGSALVRYPLHEMDLVFAGKPGDQARHARKRLLLDHDVHVACDDVGVMPRVADHAIGNTVVREESKQRLRHIATLIHVHAAILSYCSSAAAAMFFFAARAAFEAGGFGAIVGNEATRDTLGRITFLADPYVAAARGYQHPIGEWNFQEVTVKGSTIKVELNGTVILDTDLSKVDMTQVMGGKDGPSPHPGKDRTSGFFGFAGHNDPVAFRNVLIKKL